MLVTHVSIRRLGPLGLLAFMIISVVAYLIHDSQSGPVQTEGGTAAWPGDSQLGPHHDAENTSADSSATNVHTAPGFRNARLPLQSDRGGFAPNLTCEGIVLNDEGTFVEGARVQDRTEHDRYSITDSQGAFSLGLARRPEPLHVEVSYPGMVPLAGVCIPGRFSTFHLKNGVTVGGRVLMDEGEAGLYPVSNQPITIRPYDGQRTPHIDTTTSAEGEYEFVSAVGSKVRIEVPVDGRSAWLETIFIPSRGLQHDIIISPRSVRVRIEVLDALTQMPVEGARITCNDYESGATDSEGTFTLLANIDQDQVVRASAPGYCAERARIRPADLPGDSIQLVLQRGASFTGRVLSASGEPVEGAEVEFTDPISHPPRAVFPWIEGLKVGTTTHTDPLGNFGFSQIGSRYGTTHLVVIVRHPQYALLRSDPILVPNGGGIGPIEFTLEYGASVYGVVTADGQPAHATLSLDRSRPSVHTDSLGRYELASVGGGPHTLAVSLDSHPCVKKTIKLEVPSGEAVQLDIQLDYDLHLITGFVLTPDGLPLANVLISCESSTFDEFHPMVYSARTNSNGAYEIEVPIAKNDPGQSYRLFLRRWGEAGNDCEVKGIRPPARIDLECQVCGWVDLEVIDERSGAPPIGWYDVQWYPDASNVPIACYDRWQVGDQRTRVAVPCGSGKLEILKSFYESRMLDVTVGPFETVDLGVIRLRARAESSRW